MPALGDHCHRLDFRRCAGVIFLAYLGGRGRTAGSRLVPRIRRASVPAPGHRPRFRWRRTLRTLTDAEVLRRTRAQSRASLRYRAAARPAIWPDHATWPAARDGLPARWAETCRQARPHTAHDDHRYSRSRLKRAVALHPRQTRRRPAQDLVRLPRLTRLALMGLQPRRHLRHRPRRPVGIALYLLHARVQRLAVQPTLATIDGIVAQRDGCCAWCSGMIRSARSGTLGEGLFIVLLAIAPTLQEMEPPTHLGGPGSPWNPRLTAIACCPSSEKPWGIALQSASLRATFRGSKMPGGKPSTLPIESTKDVTAASGKAGSGGVVPRPRPSGEGAIQTFRLGSRHRPTGDGVTRMASRIPGAVTAAEWTMPHGQSRAEFRSVE